MKDKVFNPLLHAQPLNLPVLIQAGATSVRAERSNQGNGRVYRISSFRAYDGKGGSCNGAVQVGVPLSLKKGLDQIQAAQKEYSRQCWRSLLRKEWPVLLIGLVLLFSLLL
ncbi:MAG TPA: hypothetical protein VJR69_06205 [Nitrospira sp.]|nr:hypothetical protein [Nitrospira sp.]